jgi:hypothetical protein
LNDVAIKTMMILFFSVSLATVQAAPQAVFPRTADGRPNLQGIWKAPNGATDDVRSVAEGGEIPYQPAASAKRLENFKNRAEADPLGKCYLPGVPRIMYLEFPFHIFQTRDHVAITFEWSQVFRLIYTNGRPPLHAGIESWMGDSRGLWEGDTLVVNVTNQNDRTWFDKAGNFHSEAMRIVERYTMLDADTIKYEVTIEDPKVFAKPWKITVPLYRQKNTTRILEYQCQAEIEERNGAFERDPQTWYPKQ